MTSIRSGKASVIRSASTLASAVVHSANRTRTCGPGPLALGGGRERGLGDLVGGEPELGGAPERLGHDARPGRPTPRRTGGRSTTRVPAPWRPTT